MGMPLSKRTGVDLTRLQAYGLTLEKLKGHNLDHCAKCAVSMFNGSHPGGRNIIDCRNVNCRVWLIKKGTPNERVTFVVSMKDYNNGKMADTAGLILAEMAINSVHE